MTASALTSVIIVLVVLACLVIWLTAVFHARRHPQTGRSRPPRRKISGGTFRGDPRQQMPRRDAPAEAMSTDDKPRHGE